MSALLALSDGNKLLRLTTTIVEAYVSKNSVPMADLPATIRSIHAALNGLLPGAAPDVALSAKPAVPVKKSVTPDHIICLEDGKKLKILKRYLRSRYDLSPEDYRAKWHLPADYPMVAPNYAHLRSEFAKKIGLGRIPKANKKRKRA